ncbi:MAG: hypothetical protein GXP55_15405, partial [Deltaproteobacteria bacterium]|nr:hypothetical protein [Deltaproteobacteria bacterium]
MSKPCARNPRHTPLLLVGALLIVSCGGSAEGPFRQDRREYVEPVSTGGEEAESVGYVSTSDSGDVQPDEPSPPASPMASPPPVAMDSDVADEVVSEATMIQSAAPRAASRRSAAQTAGIDA